MEARPATALNSSTTLAAELAAILRDEILTGKLEPGYRLRQQDVASRFSVSTTPVREAFAALEREGVVMSSPHRGVIVFRPTLEDLMHTYEIRVRLESLATEKAVPNLSTANLRELKKLLDEMGTLDGPDPRYTVLNERFHERIYRAARRPKLSALIAELRAHSISYMRIFGVSHPFSATETQAAHTAIYKACAAGDAERAARHISEHLQHTVDVVGPLLDGSEAR